MRILVHVGVPQCGANLLQAALDNSRAQLLRKGVLYSEAAGRKSHTKLYMAVSDPGHVDPLRFARGYATAAAQDRLRRGLAQDILAEAGRHPDAELMVFSASQLATLPNRTELERLKALLGPVSTDITILAHVDEQAKVMLRHYAEALWEGRTAPLTQEISLAESGLAWVSNALAAWTRPAHLTQEFPETQSVPHWLDYVGLVARWQEVFGMDKVILRSYDPVRFGQDVITEELSAVLGLKSLSGKIDEMPLTEPTPSAATLTRWRLMNTVLVKLLANGKAIPRNLWKTLLADIAIAGPLPEPGALSEVSKRFEKDNNALVKAHPALDAACLKRDRAKKVWTEADPCFGFRATQYAAALLPRLDDAVATAPTVIPAATTTELTPTAERLLSERAKENFHHIKGTRFAPHNRIGLIDETSLGPAFAEIAPRSLPDSSTGKVIVGCMKNEAPYILEWIAYHRQIGVDNFLIYTNDCSDGTHEVLDRLQELGIVQHRLNNDWKGNSPQQHALNKAMREDLVRNADWLIHIDVDEFINIRVGNGTLDDFLALTPTPQMSQ